MTLLNAETLRLLAKSLLPNLPRAFTGKVVITLNFKDGAASGAAVAVEEGTKL